MIPVVFFLALGLIIILFGFFYLFRIGTPKSEDISASPAATPVNKITEISPEKRLAGFPSESELPIISGATVTRSFEAKSPDGKTQATKILNASISVRQAFDFYKKFLSDNQSGWKILAEINNPDTPDNKALFAQSAKGIININISVGAQSGTSVIDLSFLLN